MNLSYKYGVYNKLFKISIIKISFVLFWFFFWMNIDFYLIGIKRFIEYMDYVYFKYWMSIYFKNMRIVFFEIKERFFSFIIWRYIVYIKNF